MVIRNIIIVAQLYDEQLFYLTLCVMVDVLKAGYGIGRRSLLAAVFDCIVLRCFIASSEIAFFA